MSDSLKTKRYAQVENNIILLADMKKRESEAEKKKEEESIEMEKEVASRVKSRVKVILK